MKAAVINTYGSPDVFEINEVPVPEPEENEVLIRVKASSVNPVDWKIRQGNLKYILGSHFPIILGFDASGIVEKTGKSVSRIKKGDHVYGRIDKKYGRALAQYAVGSEDVFSKVPESLDFNSAAAIPLAALTALQGLRDKGNIKPADEVLIIGATGGVGNFAVQVAKNYQARVTALCGNGHEEMLHSLQPTKIINYHQQNILETDHTYDIIFDAAGIYNFPEIIHLLKKNGRYIHTLPRPKILLHKLRAFFTNGKKVKTLLMKPNYKDLEQINAWIANKNFKVFIDSVFKLDAITEAHKKAEEYHTEGKIVIEIDE